MTIARTQKSIDPLSTHHTGFSLISNEKLLELYALMLKCRMLDERIAALDGVAAAVPVAAIAGAAADLAPADTLAPSYRGFAPSLAKGLAPEAIFSLLAHTAATRAPYASLGLVPPMSRPARQLESAFKAAAEAKKKKAVVVAFLGDSSKLGDEFFGALAAAGKKKLPILFVCQTGADGEEITPKSNERGVPGVIVDADDAVAVYRVATEALAHARRRSGPTLIECKSWLEPGSRKRKPMDPIKNMEAYLERKGLFSRKYKAQAKAAFRRELNAAASAAHAAKA